jgi:hypothetical protein
MQLQVQLQYVPTIVKSTAIEVFNVKYILESECVHSIVTFHREVWISNECEKKYG